MTLLPATALIENGQPRLGQFADTLGVLNVDAFRYLNPFGKAYGPMARHFHYKRFQYFGGMSERLVFGCALADIRYLGAGFVYVYDFERKALFARSFRTPLGLGLNLSASPLMGSSTLRQGGASLAMHYENAPRRKILRVDIGTTLSIDATMAEPAFEPMSICTRTAYPGWVYANKTAGLALQGELQFQGERFDLQALQACGHHDFSCGYMRRETFWNWACFSGFAGGKCLGLNLSCGVNETSYTENCLWVDGRLIKVNLTRFDFDRGNVLAPWRVCSDDGLVDLCFTPQGMHQERLNAGFLASNFKQVFGHFSGRLALPDGTITVSGLPGFVEDQYAKW
jgi:hypothetical protein